MELKATQEAELARIEVELQTTKKGQQQQRQQKQMEEHFRVLADLDLSTDDSDSDDDSNDSDGGGAERKQNGASTNVASTTRVGVNGASTAAKRRPTTPQRTGSGKRPGGSSATETAVTIGTLSALSPAELSARALGAGVLAGELSAIMDSHFSAGLKQGKVRPAAAHLPRQRPPDQRCVGTIGN